ncbi:hypothetical protein DIPPA_26142 [Diplonema papillatum]|nr:hypothetical protein DIPPA_34464 [Diplonema papillatum]KAJ9441960.1 hypothetical protein DIPPA_19799 [Diplonema papillatum]KAJ9446471.1 hypothetical protein DIPPA_26142 [Diplonema papillatum]
MSCLHHTDLCGIVEHLAWQTTGMILVMTSDLGKTDVSPAIDEERRRAQGWSAEKLTDERRAFGRTTIVQFSALHETDFFEILEHWARSIPAPREP